MYRGPQNQKALFRVGQRVRYDHLEGAIFRVTAKEWDYHGTLFYTIQRNVGTDAFDNFPTMGGIRQKHLNKV